MKTTISCWFKVILLLIFAINSLAESLDEFALTPNQVRTVEQKLNDYESGRLSLDDLNGKPGQAIEENNRQLVGYYLIRSNTVSIKATLPICRAFASFSLFTNAVTLGTNYVKTYNNDWHAWRALAFCYANLRYSNEVLTAYSNAVRLGDEESCLQYAEMGFYYHRLDIVREMAPRLLKRKDSTAISASDRLETVSFLILYAEEIQDPKLFVNVVRGVTTEDVNKSNELNGNIKLGCTLFAGKNPEIDAISQRFGFNQTINGNPDGNKNMTIK